MSEPWEPDLAPSDEEYFLEAIDELRGLVGLRATAYQAIRAAGLLRILLTADKGGTLIDKVKTSTGSESPRFSVALVMTFRRRAEATFTLAGVLLDPRVTVELKGLSTPEKPWKPHDLDLKAFLKVHVLGHGDKHATVLDLIHLYANKMGGSHRENAGTQARSEVLSLFLPEWEPALRQSLIAAARVTLEAVRPMELELALGRRPVPFGLDFSDPWIPESWRATTVEEPAPDVD